MTEFDREPQAAHPMVIEARAALAEGRMTRRDFVRTATLLGVSAGAAYAMAGVVTGQGAFSTPARAATPKKGGVLKVSMPVQEDKDPATYDWVQMSNILRHQNEYLTITGADNITRPMLAESWSASDDLKEWTFNIRKGVKWHNGDELTAEHVAFNFNRWLDPKTGSSNIGLFAAMVEEFETGEKDKEGKPVKSKRAIKDAVTVVDKYTLKLRLKSPVLSMAENLYNYPTAILHPKTTGKAMADRLGTGAYQVVQHAVGEKAILKRAPGEYWGAKIEHIGPGYVDEIHYYDHGSEGAGQATAVMDGSAHMCYEIGVENLDLAKAIPGAKVYAADSASTVCLRMRADVKPFNDRRVRRAIQLCCDSTVYPKLIYQGAGRPGEHHHVCQIHPEYYPLPEWKQNIAEAKKLLAEAGYPNGLTISIDVGNTDGPYEQQVAEILKEQCKAAGITLNINLMPAAKYWEVWDKTGFGLTAWVHRPLGTMVLSLGYRSGVPWNESAHNDPKFDAALDKAEGILDVAKRREAMKDVEQILQDNAAMVQPLWRPRFFVAKDNVKGLGAHPTVYHQFNKVWIEG